MKMIKSPSLSRESRRESEREREKFIDTEKDTTQETKPQTSTNRHSKSCPEARHGELNVSLALGGGGWGKTAVRGVKIN